MQKLTVVFLLFLIIVTHAALNSENCETHQTNWNDPGDGRIEYLDRHEIDCGSYSALTEFRVT